MEKLGLVENEEKPFWAKYLKSAQEVPEKPGILEGVVAVFEGEKDVDELIREQQSVQSESQKSERSTQGKGPSTDKFDKSWAKTRDLEQ